MEDKEPRTKQVHITFSEKEKAKIKLFAESIDKSIREFIREATFERIRRIEHPEQFSHGNISQFNPAILEQLTKNTRKIIELQKLTNERLNIAENIEKTIQAIKEQYKKLKKKNLIGSFSKESRIIADLLEGHKSLTPDQISKMSKIDIDDIYLILTGFNKFKLNTTTGRFELR